MAGAGCNSGRRLERPDDLGVGAQIHREVVEVGRSFFLESAGPLGEDDADGLRDFFDGVAGLDQAGCEIAELLIAILAQLFERGLAFVELFESIAKLRSGGGFHGRVKLFGGDLFIVDGLEARVLLFAGVGVGLITDLARLVVLVPTQLAGDDGKEAERLPQLGAKPHQRCGADLHIAVFVDRRVEQVPILLEQIVEKLETRREANETFLANMRIRQPDGDLQIFAALGNGLAAHLDDGRPIGRLEGGLPDTLVYVQIFPAGFFNFVGDGVVA